MAALPRKRSIVVPVTFMYLCVQGAKFFVLLLEFHRYNCFEGQMTFYTNNSFKYHKLHFTLDIRIFTLLEELLNVVCSSGLENWD
jgi:hypothetical protein